MFNLENILKGINTFIDLRIQLLKVEFKNILSSVVTFLVILILVLFFLLMMIVFLGLSAGFYLNSVFNSSYLGFLFMGFIFFCLVVIIIFSKNIIHKAIKKLATKIVDN